MVLLPYQVVNITLPYIYEIKQQQMDNTASMKHNVIRVSVDMRSLHIRY